MLTREQIERSVASTEPPRDRGGEDRRADAKAIEDVVLQRSRREIAAVRTPQRATGGGLGRASTEPPRDRGGEHVNISAPACFFL